MLKQWAFSENVPQIVTCWCVGAMWVFAWTVKLLFVRTILSWEVFATLSPFPLLLLFLVSDAVGAPAKCLLLGWCILPPPIGSIDWVIHSCFFLPSLLEGTTPDRGAWELKPHIFGPRPKTKTDMKLQKTDAWPQTVCVIHAPELPVGSAWSWTPADIHSLISSFSS